jgi:hypothetical protein
MFKNEFFERTNLFSTKLGAENRKNKLQSMFAPKSYAETNKGIFWGSLALSYVCNLVSIISSLTFISLFLYQSTMQLGTTPAILIAVVVGVFCVSLIEIIKRGAIRTTIKQFLQYRTFRSELAIVAILTVLFSVATSFYGAKQLPQLTTPAPLLVNVDSIQNVYSVKIENATTLHTYKPTKTLTQTGASLIAQLESERASEIAELKRANTQMVEDSQKAVQGLEYTFCTIVGINELLLILCVLFVMYYQFRSYLELRAHEEQEPTQYTKEEVKTPQTAKFKPSEDKQHPHEVSARTIGFSALAESEKICKNCGSTFTHNHKKQKYCNTGCRMQYHNRKRQNMKR